MNRGILRIRKVRNKETNRNKRKFVIKALRLMIGKKSVGKEYVKRVALSQYLDIWVELICPEDLTPGIMA